MALNKKNANLVIQAGLDLGMNNHELAILMGQTQVESTGFYRLHESFHYTDPQHFLHVFKHHNGLENLEQAKKIIGQPKEQVADFVYGGEWGKTSSLGNTQEGDGWKYHGRGFIQITGRSNYQRYAKKTGLDLINHPDLAVEPKNAAKIAAAFVKDVIKDVRLHNNNQIDFDKITYRINTQKRNIKDRKKFAREWEERFNNGYLEKNNLVAHIKSESKQKNQLDKHASVRDLFEHLYAATKTKDVDLFAQAVKEVGRTDYIQQLHQETSAIVNSKLAEQALAQQLTLQQKQQEQQTEQTHTQPVMAIRRC